MPQQKNLLIVANDRRLAYNYQKNLKDLDCRILIAVDINQVQEICHQQKPGLIIIDLDWPKAENGTLLCRLIRKYDRKTPLLAISQNGEINRKVELFDLGIDDYLVKPIAWPELSARIRALDRRRAPISDNIINIGQLTIDRRQKIVKKDHREIFLTRKEFLTLEYLAEHPGKVVSREEIMEHAWDATADIFSKTIETHMYSLRHKIGTGNTGSIIKTIPGQGYRLLDRII
jgi:DNA-binding response OmpR family regulator